MEENIFLFPMAFSYLWLNISNDEKSHDVALSGKLNQVLPSIASHFFLNQARVSSCFSFFSCPQRARVAPNKPIIQAHPARNHFISHKVLGFMATSIFVRRILDKTSEHYS